MKNLIFFIFMSFDTNKQMNTQSLVWMHLSLFLTTNEPKDFTDELHDQPETTDDDRLQDIMNLIYTVLKKVQVLRKGSLSTTSSTVETVVTESINVMSVDNTDYDQMRRWFFITGIFFCAVLFLVIINGLKHDRIKSLCTGCGQSSLHVSGGMGAHDNKGDTHVLSPHPMFHLKNTPKQ